ncbi:MAG: ATP-binding protein [Myxococcota bacterium]
MFKDLRIHGFRCFESLTVSDLGRVNLLVGENGAGKTSVLEGMRLLYSGGNPISLLASALERGEYDSDEDERGHLERVAVLRFVFFGRAAERGAQLSIEGQKPDGTSQVVHAEIVDVSANDPEAPQFGVPIMGKGTEWQGMFPDWAIRIRRDEGSASVDVPIAWSPGSARRLRLMAPRWDSRSRMAIPVFLRANGIDDTVLGQLWDQVVATPDKDAVVRSLRYVERSIQDIDLRSDPRLPFRSRVAVRLDNDAASPAPIGSLGEGIAWLFTLALGAMATPSRLLLVDDIDAGLHHRVMTPMWSMILDTARRRGLQILATTHSIDCITALRRVVTDQPDLADEIRVIRLVKGGREGITFTADELDAAIEGEVEVRG